jgi:Lrp/AsnC family leucine-responsive transcriptional regulator
VVERVRKLEAEGFIRGYHASLDPRRLGLDVTAFIGVSIAHPRAIESFEKQLATVGDVMECHHVTGGHTLLLKVKTHNTESLERLISALRSLDGVLLRRHGLHVADDEGDADEDAHPEQDDPDPPVPDLRCEHGERLTGGGRRPHVHHGVREVVVPGCSNSGVPLSR